MAWTGALLLFVGLLKLKYTPLADYACDLDVWSSREKTTRNKTSHSNVPDVLQHLFQRQSSGIFHSPPYSASRLWNLKYISSLLSDRLAHMHGADNLLKTVRRSVHTAIRRSVYRRSYTDLQGLHRDTRRWFSRLSEDEWHILATCEVLLRAMSGGCDQTATMADKEPRPSSTTDNTDIS